MPIRVVATGRVAEEPRQPLGEDTWMVFVLDPFPGLPGARLGHACEVVCRGSQGVATGPGGVEAGDRVEVTGELVMERIDGPIEDDLSAVRVWIKATGVSVPK